MSTKRFLAGLVALLMALSILPAISLADNLGEYAPITTMEELVEGDYVIYNIRDTYSGVMNNTFSGGRFKASTPTFSGDNIVVTDNSVIWHIAYVEGSGYTVYNAAAGKYAEITANSTSGFSFNDAPTMYYTIELNDDGTFDIYNAAQNNRAICIYQTDFRPYTVDGTNYNPVHLYKYVEEAGDQCSAPAATPNGGTVKYGQQVSLICTTADATIYYSVDEGDTYEEYTGPFYLTESVDVYAYASADGMADSAVVTFSFTVEDEIDAVTIAAAKELENSTYTKVTGIVNFIDGKNVYVEDATGGICLYFLHADDPTLAELALGDEVTAVGMKTTYKGLYELSNVVGGNPYWVSIDSTGNALPVQNVTLADLTANAIDYQCERVYLQNVELGVINNAGNTPVTDGANTINAYKLPALTGISDYDIVDMYAVIGWYDAAQLRVQYAADVTLVATMQTLTINYQYEDGAMAAPAYSEGYAQGASYSVASPEITGYIPDVAVVEGVMGAEDVTVTVTYILDETVPTYVLTINYQYEDGTEAAESYIAELYENDEYSVASPVIEGYTADILAVTGVMPAEAVTVTVTYTAIAAAEETTYELVTDLNDMVSGDQYIIVGVNEDAYCAMGYQKNNNRQAIAVTPNADGTITVIPSVLADDQTSVFELTFVYDAELEGWTILDPVTPGYLYAAGSSANYLRTQTVNDVNGVWTIAFEDGVASVVAAGSSNRNVMQYNSGSSLFACYASASQKPVYIYHKVEGYVPATTHTLTINYVDENGAELAPAYVAEVAEGADYEVTSPEIEGYECGQAVVMGTMGNEDVTVNVVYVGGVEPVFYTLTINYIYEDGTTAAESFTCDYAEGVEYNIASPEIEGYIPDAAVVSGTMPAEAVTVTVTYSPVPVAEETTYRLVTDVNDLVEGHEYIFVGFNNDDCYAMGYQRGNNRQAIAVTVNADGTVTLTPSVAADDQTSVFEFTFGYDTELAGWTFFDALNNGYLYAAAGGNYLRTQAEVDVNAAWTIVIEDGVASVVAAGSSNRNVMQYNSGSTIFSTYASASQKPVYIYEKVEGYVPVETYTLTVNYQYEDGTEAAPAYVEELIEGAAYSVASPEIVGYEADVAVVEGVMGAEDVTVTVTYTAIPVPTHYLTVLYQYEDGAEAAPAYVAELMEGEAYTVASPEIEGYNADVTEVTGVMGEEDVIVTVTYAAIPVSEETTYEIVTDETGLVEGEQYIIVGSEGDVRYMMGYQRGNNRGDVQVTVNEDGTITTTPAVLADDTAAAFEFTLGYDTEVGGWTFYDAVTGGYLYAASSSSNYLRTQAENNANGVWTIAFPGDEVASVTAMGSNTRNVMQFNSGSDIFACYASASQKAVYLYKKVAGTVEPTTHTLTINYVDIFGNPVAEPFVYELNEGDPYLIHAADIELMVPTVDYVDGTMGAEDIEYTITYCLLGDVDCNGTVSFADISTMYLYILSMGEISDYGRISADFDRDGNIGFSDISAIYLYILAA